MEKNNLLNLSMFILRLVVGAIFLAHGAQKLFGMFNGLGLEGTTKMAEGLGLPNPFLSALVWGLVEFTGGIFLVFGILSRWAALVIVLVVFFIMCKVNLMYGFFLQDGGIEFQLLILASCMPIILIGGGSWSVWDI